MDLKGGSPYWLFTHGMRTVVPALTSDVRCDVAIVGSGIIGALCASLLTAQGASVVLVDRRDLGQGSTLASTGLLQYDLDVPLFKLERTIGPDTARRAFRLGVEAITDLERLARRVGGTVERLPSLYLARRPRAVAELEQEFEARRGAGLKVRWHDRRSLANAWGIRALAAIESRDSGQCDPFALTHALLAHAARRGAVLADRTTITSARATRRGVTLATDRGAQIRADTVIRATGYESAALIPESKVELRSTYALISEPLAAPPPRCTVWEYADPYTYARPAGDRLLIGGGDVPFTNADARDRLISRKSRTLLRDARALYPSIRPDVAFAWTGTFAVTDDGLGFIGPAPGRPRDLFAIGFGGNGITCGMIAARLLSDYLAGRSNPDLAMYRLDRPAVRPPA